jgi:putative ABC transport system permease protein
VLHDLRYATRLIAKDRWFSAAVIVTLALGIGVNATGFTLVNGVLLRERSLRDSEQVFVLSWEGEGGRKVQLSYPEIEEFRAQSQSFAYLAGVTDETFNISDDRGLPQRAHGSRLLGEAFAVFRYRPLAGRGFTADDERNGAAPVAIIGHHVWKNRYAQDPAAIGATLRVNGEAATIVGVMPPGMRFPGNAELWMPFRPTPAQEQRSFRLLTAYARLVPGVSRRQAETEATALAQRAIAAYPDDTRELVKMALESVPDRFVGKGPRTMFLAMMGAVSFVLLITCANVANLLLARSAIRAREIALRMALGATRLRVARQLLLESVLLGGAGAALGLCLAYGGVRLFDAAVLDSSRPYWIVFSMDYVVFAYVASVGVLTALLAGLAPAMHLSRRNSSEVLKEGGRGSVGSPRIRWFSGAMVVAQFALTIVLLAGAGLMVRSLYNLRGVDNGYDPEHLLTMRLLLPGAKYPTADARREFYEQFELRVGAVAGVDGAAITTAVPPTNNEEWRLDIEGRAVDMPPSVSVIRIGPQFFDVLGRTLLRGRSIERTDGAPGTLGVVINERLVRQLFSGEDPIGRRVRFIQRNPRRSDAPGPWRTIVGVSPDIRHSTPADAETDPVVYVPYGFEPPSGARVLVRSQLPPSSLLAEIRRVVQTIDRDQPVYSFQTVDDFVKERQWPYSAFGGAFAIFAVIALVLSAVGLYAVMAYSVTQRTAEIGVRMALGAGRRHVSWLFLRRGLTQVAIGLVLGLAGAFALSRVLQTLLVGVTAGDPLTFAAVAIVLTLVAIVACLVPVRRAAAIAPITALRSE